MKTKYSIYAALPLVVFLLFSCTTLDPDWAMRYVKTYSAEGFNIKNCRLAIEPFKCGIPEIGQTVSDSIIANLLGFAFVITQHRDATTDYLLTGNIAIAELIGEKGKKSYIAGATCKIIHLSSGKIVKTVTFGKAVDLHGAVELGEMLAKGIKREQ